MARKKKNNISSMKILMAVIFINIAIYCIFSKTDLETFLGNISEVIDTNISETNALSNVTQIVDGNLNVHYIDVGQGDAILIENNGKFMLIDSGPSSAKDDLKKYLDEKGVKVLEYLVATHNHEDHIGSMTTVINNYTVNKLIMSKNIAITRVYENFVIAAKDDAKRSIYENGLEQTPANAAQLLKNAYNAIDRAVEKANAMNKQ
jgi:beta-lactamase superfamily II metal-dependent hydrolase